MRYARRMALFTLCAFLLALPQVVHAQVAVSITVGPPALPIYEQPLVPGPGYIWVPGYWVYGPAGYYWVPGVWVIAPTPGYLWTPGYWGWASGIYVWHAGYWGPHVGYYGGINYGFGYTGVGFAGGYWRGNTYYYNTAVTRVDVTRVHYTYNTTVVNNYGATSRVAYNGGPGGVVARPTPAEEGAARERHIAATQTQAQHERMAGSNREMLASVNRGAPSVGASPRAGVFSGAGVTSARAGAEAREVNRGAATEAGRGREPGYTATGQQKGYATNNAANTGQAKGSANGPATQSHPANSAYPAQQPQGGRNAGAQNPNRQEQTPKQEHGGGKQPQSQHSGEPHGGKPPR